jgi:phosphoribosylamine-glycine ligase
MPIITAVAQGDVRVFVRTGGMGGYSSLPIVTLEIEHGVRRVSCEMTPGQTRNLIGALGAALALESADKPEGTE